MVKVLALHSNGQLVGYNENNEKVVDEDLLMPAVKKLVEENKIDADTDFFTALSSEPIPLTNWYDFLEQKSTDEVDKVPK